MPTAESKVLEGKTVITNTLTPQDIENLKERGIETVVTSTKEFDGRTFATNVIEGILITLAGKSPEEMTPEDYLKILHELDWKPTVRKIKV